jgi:hypothetical protein
MTKIAVLQTLFTIPSFFSNTTQQLKLEISNGHKSVGISPPLPLMMETDPAVETL